MHMRRPRVLVVEDERSISEPLGAYLADEGFDVEVAADGLGGIEAAERRPPDVILLDIGLPDVNGRDVCRTIRARSQVPIIMLTARGGETDRIVGLELGADDYVVKPFSAAELVARMRALLRRAGRAAAPAPDVVAVGEVTLDGRTWTVTRRGERVELTRKEFELLRLLMRNAGTVLTREQLIDEVWDPNWYGSTKTLDVHVGQLRRKLGDDPADPRYVRTVRGVGFRFASAAELS
jgi:two-component system response regulator RegX3